MSTIIRLLVQIIPIGLFGAIVPTRIVVAILLLTSTRPLRNAQAYLAGLGGFYLVVGVVALLFLGGGEATNPKATIIAATIEVVMGVFLLAFGIRSLLRITDPAGPDDLDDPDAPPTWWMKRITTLSTGASFLLGLILAFSIRFLMIYLSAVTIILNAPVTPGQHVIALLILIALMLLGVILPIVYYAFAPERGGAQLKLLMAWLNRHNRIIMMVLSFIFGVVFLFKGLTTLT